MMRTDVVILGAGLAGTSLAWHLAGRRDVLVIEQGAHHCAEASAQNAGMLRRLVGNVEERALACRTFEIIRDLPTADWPNGSPFRTTGCVIAIHDPDDPKAQRLALANQNLRSSGVEVQTVEGRELGAIAPAFADTPATLGYWIPEEGVCDPLELGAGFLRGARRRGAQVELNTRVLALRRSGSRITGVVTERGVIESNHVVLATAAWTGGLVRELGIRHAIRPLARHLFVSDPHELSTPTHPWCWVEDYGLYAKPDAGRFLCSPCDEFEVPPPLGPGSKRTMDPAVRARTQSELAELFPALTDLRLSNGWVGLRTFSKTRRPIVGLDPEIEGLAWMAALGGSGVSVSAALGERLASELCATSPKRRSVQTS